MKIKCILMSVLALATLASCNKEVPGVSGQGHSSLQLSIAAAPETYKIGEPGAVTTPTIRSVKVELLDGTMKVLATRILTPQQVTDAQNTSTGVILEQIPDAAGLVRITANGFNTPSTAIKDYQVDLQAVPFSGTGYIDYTAGDVNPQDGHRLKKASVKIKAEVARIEIIGGIVVNETDNGYYAVDIEEVYINNYKRTLTGTVYHCPFSAGNWENPSFADDGMTNAISMVTTPATGAFYSTDHNIGILTDKADVYHIFPVKASAKIAQTIADELIHVILKVKVYKTAADYTAKTSMPEMNWITIRTFKYGTALIDNFEGGNIYKLDLNILSDSFKPGITPPVDPHPESAKADLELKVEVEPWTVVNMTPNI